MSTRTDTAGRTFRHPSSATLAPLGGKPIAIRWWCAPEGDALAIPSEVETAATYSGVVLDDGTVILTPAEESPDAVDPSPEAPTKKSAPAGRRTRSSPASIDKKARGEAAPAPAKAGTAATTRRRAQSARRASPAQRGRPTKGS